MIRVRSDFLFVHSNRAMETHIVSTGGIHMNEMRDVQRRIAQRRHGEEIRPPRLFTFVYRLLMCGMGVGVFALAYMVNDKIGFIDLPEDFKNINFGMVSEWIPFEDWFSHTDDATMVNAIPSYQLLKENQYSNGTNQANLILDGVVMHVESGDTSLGSVTIRHDNGVIATYGHLSQIQIKQDERLQRGAVAGTYDDYVTLTFLKGGKSIDLADALIP